MEMNKEERIQYGLKLKELRKKCNLTQSEAVQKAKQALKEMDKYTEKLEDGEEICFNQAQLSNWEQGKFMPSSMNRYLLSIIYDVHISELDPHFPQEYTYEKFKEYTNSLDEENKTFIKKDGMEFENEEEMQEIEMGKLKEIEKNSNDEDKQAIRDGANIPFSYIKQLSLKMNWSIQKKTEHLVSLFMKGNLPVPQQLLNIVKETDKNKKAEMYYAYFINLYNGSYLAYIRSKKRK